MKFALSLLLSSIAAIVLAQTEQEKATNEAIERCLKENGLTAEILRNPTTDIERNGTCFFSCMGQYYGLVDKDGNPNAEGAKEYIVKHFDKEEDRKEYLDVFEKCAEEVKKLDSDDSCLKGSRLLECIMKPGGDPPNRQQEQQTE